MRLDREHAHALDAGDALAAWHDRFILPRETDVGRDHCFAGFHSFNGNGEMTGTHWLKESGLLVSPIALTSTHYVGIAHQALVEYLSKAMLRRLV